VWPGDSGCPQSLDPPNHCLLVVYFLSPSLSLMESWLRSNRCLLFHLSLSHGCGQIIVSCFISLSLYLLWLRSRLYLFPLCSGDVECYNDPLQ
jgi:hypothetical protein